MKTPTSTPKHRFRRPSSTRQAQVAMAAAFASFLALADSAMAVTYITKANNTSTWTTVGSFNTTPANDGTEVAQWDSTVTSLNTTTDIGGNFNLSGIKITNPGGAITINGAAVNTGAVTVNTTNKNFTYTGTDPVAGNAVYFTATSMPTGLTTYQPYYIVNLNTTAKTYQIAATPGGSAITSFTTAGTSVVNSVAPLLKLGASGIDMSAATVSGTLGARVLMTAPQSWNVASGKTLTTVSKTSGGMVDNGGNDLTINDGYTGTVNLANFVGLGGLIIKGGTLNLQASSNSYYNYGGNVSVTNATFVVSNNATSLGGGSLSLGSNAQITLKSTVDNTYTTNNNVSVSGNATIQNLSSNNTGAQSYTFGTLSIGSNTLTVTSGTTAGKSVTFGATTLAGNATFNVSTANTGLLVLWAVGDGGSGYGLTKNGAGTLQLTAAGTYTGNTLVSSGTLAIRNAQAMQNSALDTSGAGAVDLTGYATPTFGGLVDGAGARDLALVITAGYTGSVTTLTLNPTSGAASYSGSIADGASGMNLTKTGAGTQVLLGSNNGYTGTTIVNGGVLSIGSTGNINNTSGVSIGAGEFKYNSATALSKNVTFSTTGGTLSGTGTITPAVTITAGNTLAPGNSIGTMSFSTGLTIAGTYAAQLGGAGTTAASGTSDLAVVTGALTLGGTLSLTNDANASGKGSAGPGAYRLITFTTGLTGTFAGVTNSMNSTLHEKVVYGGSSVDLNLYRLGAANAITSTVNLANVRVGGTFGTSALSIKNNVLADNFSEGLNASGSVLSGAASTSGSFSNLAANTTDNSSLLVGLGSADTGTAGAKTGTVQINLASNGSTTSGYGNTSLTAQTVTVNGGAYDYAQATYTGAALDFGNVRIGGW